ncbi:MAG: bifunctional phosphoribosylaminoimidazolecarboxamide formyltransferase/IMP cyclohydrolase [Actinobacteria bacterium]|nr:bifunctional phosphoribosylaminoimidazolecarboxamide formyltransferase/IMP cyclohydrolase [Actinomycetota bacterium]
MRALISVWDKTGVDSLARGLAELGWELVSSGGTATFLEGQGLDVTRVETVTGAPEMLGGRVKTLHPRIHAGILARRDLPEDLETIAAHAITPIDLVCVSLYPFSSVAGRRGATEAEVVEMIDVGGPSMLRAAAKNFAHVAALSSPAQYDAVLAELREEGAVSLTTRRELAGAAFATTAAYEAAIATWFGDTEPFPSQVTLAFEKITELPYGENPHQAAAFYAEIGARRHLLSEVQQLGGKDLSFNNLGDLEGARKISREFSLPAVVIVKHANPCGVAMAATIDEAWERALAADPVSAFGCVATLNRPVNAALGARIAEHFVEVLVAPEYDDGALEALRTKKSLRILWDHERRSETTGERDFKRVLGGLLIQDRDIDVADREAMNVVCGEVPEQAWGDLLFAWCVCKHVSSNAIVIAKDLQTLGIGAGQMSRVDSVRIAVEKAREHGHDLAGSVLASDAFFPFADGAQLALDAGVTAVIQPGGSRRDAEVVAAVESAGAAMVFTGRRHFRH